MTTQSERIAVKWLQTTPMANSDYPYYAPYFEELLSNGWTEDRLIELPSKTFYTYYYARQLVPCTITEFLGKVVSIPSSVVEEKKAQGTLVEYLKNYLNNK